MDSVDNETLMNCIQKYRCIYDKSATKEDKCVERDKYIVGGLPVKEATKR